MKKYKKILITNEEINNNNENNENNINQSNQEENLENQNNLDEKKLQTKEEYEEEIRKLKEELEEKDRILFSLQNKENPEYKIPEIMGKIEVQKLFEIANENKIKQQKLKIESIKQMVKSVDEQFKNQLKIKGNAE